MITTMPRGTLSEELAIERFEALVQAQQPATQPWTPVTDYSFEARKEIEGPHVQLIADVFKPRYILDAGAGHGHLARMLRDHGFSPVWAVDKHAWPHNDVRELDITEDIPVRGFVDGRPPGPLMDLVICREVLEHLTVLEIRHAVRTLCRLSSRYVYVTTRFHPNPQSLLDVATSDDLDPTHITLLNQDFLRVLFILEGFTRRSDLEQQMDWQHKGRVLVYERA